MAFSKIILNGTTLIDLTQDTVSTNSLMTSYTAHDAAGQSIVGTATGGGGIDIPVFTVTFDSNWEEVQSVTCNKTFSECLALYEDNQQYIAYVIFTDGNEEQVGYACAYTAGSTDIHFAITPDLSSDIIYDRLGQIYFTGLPSGSGYADNITITQNGVYDPTDFDYRPFWGVTVSVPSPTLSTLSVTQNGTYTAPQGSAYDEVNVAVPNTYSASDEGKVVSSGALVAQTSDTVTQNGTVDTTLINSLVVDVANGGGGGIGTLLVEKHLGQVTCSSTSATSTGYTVSLSNLADYDMFISVIFCKAVNGRHVATVSVMWRQYNNNGTSRLDVGGTSLNYRMSSNVIYTGVGSSSVCGVYPATKTNIGGATTTTVNITAKYQGTTTQTIDGDYTARIYGVKLPNFLS